MIHAQNTANLHHVKLLKRQVYSLVNAKNSMKTLTMKLLKLMILIQPVQLKS